MSNFGNLYSKYYDLLYSDKDYSGEVEYIVALIKEDSSKHKTILDMGCGTGKHAELLCDFGYKVHGIDLSIDMLKIAKDRRVGKEKNLTFSHSNIQELNLDEDFDIVTSLFHVMGYQNTNKELVRAFEVAYNHLKKDGLFIFDFWYGPAVLIDLPTTRVKRLKNKEIKVTRIAEPSLHPQENLVDVNYDIFLEDNNLKHIFEKKEQHTVRYFFDTELELICNQVGLHIEKKYLWMSNKCPSSKSWNVVWVLKK